MQQLIMYVQAGLKRRNVNVTGMNKNSSRSHAVLQVLVEQRWVMQDTASSQKAKTQASPVPNNKSDIMSNLGMNT